MGQWIDKRLKTYRSINVHKLTEAIAIGIFGIGVISTYILASMAYNTSSSRHEAELERQTASISSYVYSEFAQYEQILKNTAAFSDLSGQNMTRELWRQYVQRSEIVSDHPTMLGIGYVDVFSGSERREYIGELNAQYQRPIELTPTEPRSFYTSISYLEPLNDVNRRAVGYDMFSEPVRRVAMERARDNQVVALSGPVKLVQDEGAESIYGVIMYFPVYESGTVPATVAERRETLEAYVYVVSRPADISALLDSERIGESVDFRLNDGATELYDSVAGDNSGQLWSAPMDLYGRNWTITTRVDRGVVNYWTGAVLIMLAGGVLSGVLAVLVFRLLSRRIRYLEQEHDESIATTKNELVMLASHQLRTPASGVKQYLGMLIEGLVGDLGELERSIITKAYDANERQIETIDQILHVARADAGRLALQYSRFDLVKLVGAVAKEAANDATRKNITIHTKGALTMSVIADKRYLTMALENLLSNAIKYSYPNSSIQVVVRNTAKSAIIEVHDEGVGIDEQQADEVFDKFVRLDNPLSVQEGGTGLGLFLVKQIALAHGGSVTVQPSPRQGTVFTLKIPLKKPQRRRS